MLEDDNNQTALPLRMIAQWAYCPRLFHYMHVEATMVANEHVWRGRIANNDSPHVTLAPGVWDADAIEVAFTHTPPYSVPPCRTV